VKTEYILKNEGKNSMKTTRWMRRAACLIVSAAAFATAQVTAVRVACVGNSITIGSNATQPYPAQLGQLLGAHYSVRNYGVSGRTLLKKGDFPYWNEPAFTEVQSFRPHVIIMCLGTNDSKPYNWAFKSEFYGDYMDMISAFRKAVPNAHIIVCNPPPAYSAAWDISNAVIHDEIIPILRQVRSAAKTDSIDFYGPMTGQSALFPDGIHPNNAGYALMADIAQNAIVNSPSGIIRYFNVYPASFEKGGTSRLYWETTQHSGVTINGTVVKSADSLSVSPAGTTEYTLRTQGVFSDSVSIAPAYLPPGRIKSFSAYPPFLDEGSGDSSELRWFTTTGSAAALDGEAVEANGFKTVAPSKTTVYTLAVSGEENHTSTVTVAVLPPDQINRAASRPVVTASSSGGSLPEWAVDGDTATAWLSGKTGSQSFYVDLGTTFDIKHAALVWGGTYGVLYHLYAMDALGAESRKITSQYNGDGGTDDHTGLDQTGRWVRMTCITKSNRDSALVLKEIRIYGTRPGMGIKGKAEGRCAVKFEMAQNYPNPFNPSTRFEYSTVSPGRVKIGIFDVKGRIVRVLVDASQSEGSHGVVWDGQSDDGTAADTGVYFARMEAEGFTASRKILYLK
jgi:acyl-CoA thioesterase-1